jgi:hypothetical protein
MTDTALDDLGPVDHLVVEFPAGASTFTGEMAAELLALVDSGTIRVIDILILTKDEAPFASAVRRSGGQLIATGRIPIQAVIASIEADDATTNVGA